MLLAAERAAGLRPWLPPASETIILEGLDRGRCRGTWSRTCSRRARGVGAAVRAAPRRRGEGNPLYVEEIVRQLQETGGIVVEGGEARLRSADVKVPETIHDIIAARVDRLAESLKQTLQAAAVVGRRFGVSLRLPRPARPAAITSPATSGSSTPSTSSSRRRGSRADVQLQARAHAGRRVRGPAGAPPAAHTTPPPAAALEELYAGRLDEVVELLAYHFGRSGEDEKAVDYAILAAEKAQRRWANTEALALFEAALKRLATMPDTEANRLRRIDAVVKQAEIKFALGRHVEHVQALEAIREWSRHRRPAPPRRLVLLDRVPPQPDRRAVRTSPSRYCREAMAIADARGLDEIRAYAECCLAPRLRRRRASCARRLASGGRALAIFEARGNVWWACRTLWGSQHGAPMALGEWEREPRVLPAGARARPGGQRPATQGGGLVAHGLDAHAAGRSRAMGLECCERGAGALPDSVRFCDDARREGLLL